MFLDDIGGGLAGFQHDLEHVFGDLIIDLTAPEPGTVVLDLSTNVYVGGILWQDLHGFNGSDVAYGNDRWVFVSSKQTRWDRNKNTEVEYTSDVYENNPNWYQLAPYRSTFAERAYASSALIQPKKENPLNDWVTVGENSQTRMQTGESNLENVSFWRTRNINEGETISQIPKYDAAQIMGLFVNAKNRNINLTRWTPYSSSSTYFKTTNWYSITPLTTRPLYAYDEYGNYPVTITESPFVFDVGSNVGQIPDPGSRSTDFYGIFGAGSYKQDPDINNMETYGLLAGVVRMTNYLDFDYMAEDFVGESRYINY
jgi:hypothetical protein